MLEGVRHRICEMGIICVDAWQIMNSLSNQNKSVTQNDGQLKWLPRLARRWR